MPLLVVKEEGPALLGRNWLGEIKIDWPRIKQLTSHDKRPEEILQKHAPLFGEGLGALQGTKTRIHVDPTATPMFHKARPVPYALRGQTFTELDLSHAYEQMLVDDDSKEFLTINTHKGLFRYNRFPYGVSSAPRIFHRTMEGLL